MWKPSECGNLAHLQTMILDNLADGVIAIDRDGCIVYWNRAAERLCRLSARRALGKRPRDMQLSPWFGADEEAVVVAALEGDGVWRRDAVRPNGSGHTMHLDCRSPPQGSGRRIRRHPRVLRDVTSAKRLQQDQEQRIEAVRRAWDGSGSRRVAPHLLTLQTDPRSGGSWHDLDVYLREQGRVKFTHGICPACVTSLHPDYDSRRQPRRERRSLRCPAGAGGASLRRRSVPRHAPRVWEPIDERCRHFVGGMLAESVTLFLLLFGLGLASSEYGPSGRAATREPAPRPSASPHPPALTLAGSGAFPHPAFAPRIVVKRVMKRL